jgi:hypothetical protein
MFLFHSAHSLANLFGAMISRRDYDLRVNLRTDRTVKKKAGLSVTSRSLIVDKGGNTCGTGFLWLGRLEVQRRS